MIRVQCVNHAQRLSDADLTSYAAAYQTQVVRDFAPWHGTGLITCAVEALPKGTKPDPTAWVLGFFDNADMAGALGYHDVTPNDLPLGKVFVDTTLNDGCSVSVTGSHELLEMLGDPLIAMAMQAGPEVFYAFELCDAPEDDQFAYDINGVKVSDFVMTTWFVPGAPGPYDFRRHITAPLQLLPGGYIGAFEAKRGNWTQITARQSGAAHGREVLHTGARRERRMRDRSLWKRSTY